MQTKKAMKTSLLVVSVFVVLWTAMIGIDYWRTVRTFEKPVFARCSTGYDDGGSGTYTGIGYTIDIKGNFMPDDELPGVTHVEFYIFGNLVTAVIRD